MKMINIRKALKTLVVNGEIAKIKGDEKKHLACREIHAMLTKMQTENPKWKFI